MNKIIKFATVMALCFWSAVGAYGQWQKTIHQAFPAIDSVEQLSIDIPWEYVVTTWINNGILVETGILLENASETVLQTALKEGRYQLKADIDGRLAYIRPFPEAFPPLISGRGKVREVISVKISLPEGFVQENDKVWIRRLPEKIE